MITLCKGCGETLDDTVEVCVKCGMSNPWFDQRRNRQADSLRILRHVILGPLSSLSWRKRTLQCPACDVEVTPTAVRCGKCGAILQAARLHDRSTHSLEGIGASLLFVAGLGYAGWTRIEPWVYRIAPEFRATKQGPAELPVVVNIRQAGLRIANDSAEKRSCMVDIGTTRIFRTARFALGPREVRDLPYSSFVNGSDGLTASAGYLRARQNISVDCIDTRGAARRVMF